MLDFLLETITDSPTTYLLLCLIILVDDFVFFAPGDTAMITAGIIAANGGLVLYLVIAAGTVGGMLGDNLFYFLGRRFGPRLAERLFTGDRAQERFRWAKRQIRVRGSTIIIVGRFIPAGRTITTFACGTSMLPYRRFLIADSVAALAWASYTALLGYTGGRAFRDALWEPLVIGLGVALLLGTGAELLRRARSGTRKA